MNRKEYNCITGNVQIIEVAQSEIDAIQIIEPTIEQQNIVIQSKLDLADKKIIRALIENDQTRITEHKNSQALLRSQLK